MRLIERLHSEGTEWTIIGRRAELIKEPDEQNWKHRDTAGLANESN